MLNTRHLNKLIFLDIESVPQHPSFFDLSKTMQELFLKKFKKDSEENLMGTPMDTWDLETLYTEDMQKKVEDFYNNRAPLHPEFAKIVCISIGWFKHGDKDTPLLPAPNQELQFQTKSFYGEDELDLLKRFYEACKTALIQDANACSHALVGYNSNTFDFPMIAKRMLMNWMELPKLFDVAESKPWERGALVDVKTVYQWGVYNANASLALLCECFGVRTSKDAMDGSEVRDAYYIKKDLDGIARYCAEDVRALAEVYLRLKGMRNVVTTS